VFKNGAKGQIDTIGAKSNPLAPNGTYTCPAVRHKKQPSGNCDNPCYFGAYFVDIGSSIKRITVPESEEDTACFVYLDIDKVSKKPLVS